MKLTKAEKIHPTTVREDGVRLLRNGRPILPDPGDGLRKHDKQQTAPGYVLYSPDHSNLFLLIDMKGKIVHEWPAWTSHFGYLLPNGHLLLDTEFSPYREQGVVELDWNGKEVWFCPCQVHHDFQRLPNGNTMLLCQRYMEAAQIMPGRILSTYLYEVTPDRDIVWEWYSEEHIEELTRLVGTRFPRKDKHGDWTHSNTVQVLPETPASRDPRFKAGNVIVSHRNLDTILVIERSSGEIVWAWGPGVLEYQHASIMLDNGHILIFDNGPQRMRSVVRELDPLAGKIVWEYTGDDKSPLCARYLSNAQRLPNGNTFIFAGSPPDHGRLLEVTPEGEIVWEFQNPYAAYAQGEKIVYRAYKYSAETIKAFRRGGH